MVTALLAAWVGLQAPIELKLDVRVGDAWAVETRERYLNTAEEFDETDVWAVRGKILKVDASGADAQIERELLRTEIDGDAVPPVAGTKPDVQVVRLRATGGLALDAGSTPRTRSLARAGGLGVWFPEKPAVVGTRWSLEWPQVDKVPSAKAEWTLQGAEEIADRRTAVVGFRFDEDPAFDRPLRIEGTRWVDVETGLVLQERSTTHGFPVPGGSFLVDVVTTTKLTSFHRAR